MTDERKTRNYMRKGIREKVLKITEFDICAAVILSRINGFDSAKTYIEAVQTRR
jgi:hypothetical protein